MGATPASFPITLELGLLADQKGIASAARASDPSSSAYGNYLTLSEFARRLGADPAWRHVSPPTWRRSAAGAASSVED